jgi:hypothetical protein
MISGTNKNKRFIKQFVNESKEVFPNEIVGNDQILFKKEWEKMNGGKLAAKYNQYYKGYDIDAGGRIFNSVDQLEKYIKATELSNNQYNKYKSMPEKPIKESTVNEEEAYSVTKNTFRDYDSLNITQYDSIQFKEDGNKWIVRCVTAHDNIDKGALQKLGFGNSSSTRYAGISTFTKNANWHDLELTKKEFDQLVKIVDAGWASHAKAFADFYKNRQAD